MTKRGPLAGRRYDSAGPARATRKSSIRAPSRPTAWARMPTGPATKSNYNQLYHRAWNHFWRFSGGDIINDGVHQMDLARWLKLPAVVVARHTFP